MGGLKINNLVFGKPFIFLTYTFYKALSVCLNILSLPLFSCLIYLFSGNPAVEAAPGAVIITIHF